MLAEKGKGNDFLGGPVVKNPPANAGDMGSIPDLGRPQVPWSNQARAQLLQPKCLEPVLPTRAATTVGSSAQKGESSPHALQPEKSPHSSEDPAQPKVNNLFLSRRLQHSLLVQKLRL